MNVIRIARITQTDVLNVTALTILGAVLEAAQAGAPAPTYRELMKVTGVKGIVAIRGHLLRLQRLGLVRLGKRGEARVIVPTCRWLYLRENKHGS